MGQLWDLLQAHLDSQEYPVSERQLAKNLHLGSSSTLARWRAGETLPTPSNLVQVARVTRVPYERVLDAALHDAGYLPNPAREGAMKYASQHRAQRTRGRGPESASGLVLAVSDEDAQRHAKFAAELAQREAARTQLGRTLGQRARDAIEAVGEEPQIDPNEDGGAQ